LVSMVAISLGLHASYQPPRHAHTPHTSSEKVELKGVSVRVWREVAEGREKRLRRAAKDDKEDDKGR
jgi:hypothetical protein